MTATFRSVVAELWASLGQPAPRLDGEDFVELDAGGARLRLEGFRDSLMLVTAAIGPLSKDRMRRAEQIRTILQDSLSLLMARRGCVHLDPAEPNALIVSGLHELGAGRQRLAQLVEDVLYLRAWHADGLRGAETPKSPLQPIEDADVVFRP